MNSFDAFKSLVDQKIFSVDEEGKIWKLKQRLNNGTSKSVEPFRLEKVSSTGYLIIGFYYKGKNWAIGAHRAVYQMLVGPIPEGHDINHMDGDKKNNRPDNMETATRSENHQHAYRTGLRVASTPLVVVTLAPKVAELRAKGMSQSEVARTLGVSQTTVWRAEVYHKNPASGVRGKNSEGTA